MWMLDVAREQCLDAERLIAYAKLTAEAGYDALGLYLEHRYAYPSTPWSHGVDCLRPEDVQKVRREFPDLRLVPFVNLLGHFEGMLYTEQGKRYREARFQGMQACPSNPDFVRLCERLVDDALAAFDDELVHIGGDETQQLGQCPECQQRVDSEKGDGKAALYGEHFGPLARRVERAGRRPAVWGDMFTEHPGALEAMPKSTVIFDWQYFSGCAETSVPFAKKGFDVVGCPTLQTYNATWMNLSASEENVRQVVEDVRTHALHGVCVTTWECGLFGAYDTLFPAIRACGDLLNGKDTPFLTAYLRESETYEEWARLMGVELPEVGGSFAAGRIRSSLKVRFLLNANPFLAWLYHGDEFAGEVGEAALDVFERALAVAPNEACRGVTRFARGAVEFVRLAEEARTRYAEGKPEAAIGKLAATRAIFDDLQRVARATHARIGGSRADIERCRVAREHVERVIQRIRHHGDGSLGYLPAFEHITHPKFVPHDQAAWWLINRFANE